MVTANFDLALGTPNNSVFEVKLRAGKYMIPVKLHYLDDRIYFYFAYNKLLLEEIKNLQDRKWHAYDKVNPKKAWSCPVTERNLFVLDYLQGKNPYERYDKQLLNVSPRRELYKHQILLFRFFLTRKWGIGAADPGTGKTLAAIEFMEWLVANGYLNNSDLLYCGTISSLNSTRLELDKWNALISPRLMTYDGLRKHNEENLWASWLPKLVIFDEFSRCKNMSAQRTQAAMNLSRLMRNTYSDNCYGIGMTGSPAPKSPADWYAEAEIVRPGYLSEPNVGALTRRLALTEQEESLQGGMFPKLVTWLDDESKCGYKWKEDLGYKDENEKPVIRDRVCGKFKQEHEVDELSLGTENHNFVKSINEVSLLHKRLEGLVTVILKKDCLDLPDIVEKVVKLEPSQSVLRAAKLIAATHPSVISTLTALRQLSDGFQYEEKETGKEETCTECLGTCKVAGIIERDGILIETYETQECPNCINGKVPTWARATVECDTPKEAQLREDLEDHADIGRLVVYSGFQGSVDRITKICLSEKWNVIQADGRGWKAYSPEGAISLSSMEMLKTFQSKTGGKWVFNGHPGAAGMGITLTASPTIVYWSLSFAGEDFIQSKDRIHRLGMDVNRGATLIFYIHLGSDMLVLQNVKAKMKLQALTLGQHISMEEVARSLG